MSDVESAASEPLRPLIEGKRLLLTEERRRAVATWAALRGLLLRFAGPGELAPEAEWLSQLHSSRLPPPTCYVWLAAFRGAVEFHYEASRLLIRRDPRKPARPDWEFSNGINLTLVIGHVLINLVWIRQGEVPKPDRPGLIRIWPNPDGTPVWPPPVVFDDKGIHAISERFVRASRHMTHPEELERAMADRDAENREHSIKGFNEIKGLADELWTVERKRAEDEGTPEDVLIDIEPLLRRVIEDAVARGWQTGLRTGQDWANEEFGRLVRLHGLSDGLIPPRASEEI